MIGDLVLVHTVPPHLASVTSDKQLICEDGTILSGNGVCVTKVCSALQFIQELERSVLERYEAR